MSRGTAGAGILEEFSGPIEGDVVPLAHRDDIQGLRGVAVILVAVTHVGLPVVSGGYVGVDVFFVLSGYLITRILLVGAKERGYASVWQFYAQRARRILPAAALTLVATDVAAYFLLNFVRAKQVVVDSGFASIFAANLYFARLGTNYFDRELPPSPVQHYWTLAVEEQFYVIWPLLLLVLVFGASRRRVVTRRAIRRVSVVVLAVAAVSILWSIHETRTSPTEAYFSTGARAWELALGALLALFPTVFGRLHPASRGVIGWVGLCAICAASIGFTSTTPFPGYAALLPTLGAALVIAAAAGRQPSRLDAGRFLAIRPLRYIGDRSYSFYLWHWPVLVLAAQSATHPLSTEERFLLLLLAFALSMVSYATVENPIRRFRRGVWSGLALWPISIGVVAVTAVVCLHAINRVSTSYAAASATRAEINVLPAVRAAVAAARRAAAIPHALAPPLGRLLDDRFIFPDGCAANDGDVTTQICRMGDAKSRRLIVILGDSHAEMWMPTLLKIAAEDRWAVIPLTKSGCLPSRWIATNAQPLAECRAWYRWAIGEAQRLRPEVMMLTGSYNAPAVATEERLYDAEVGGIQSAMRAMTQYAGHVVVVGDPPAVATEPVDCLLSRRSTMRTCTSSMTGMQWSLYHAVAGVARANGSFIDPITWFCLANECPTVIGDTVTRTDLAHLTVTYARTLAPPFLAAFRAALRTTRPTG